MSRNHLRSLAAVAALLLVGLHSYRVQASTPRLQAGGILDATGFSHLLAPGTVIVLSGQNLASDERSATGLPLPTRLGGVAVEISDGGRILEAPLFSVAPERIVAQLPFDLTGPAADLTIKTPTGMNKVSVPIISRAPRLLRRADGAMVFHADGRPVGETKPISAGDVLTLYAIGFGSVDPPIQAGVAAGGGQSGSPYHQITDIVRVTLGGKESRTIFAGLVPGSAGMYQVNFEAPLSLAPGPREIVVEIAGQRSQPQLIVPVASDDTGRQFYVSPAGTAAGNGSLERPWDLASALRQPEAVHPGDTIWLLDGVYGDGKTIFVSTLRGEAGKPVIVRQHPGHRARINGGIAVEGAFTWYWGFEVVSSITDRAASGAVPHGLVVNGPETKFINLVIHNTGTGMGLWTPAENAEVYGCLIYANGYQGSDRAHGHGIYTQNLHGTKSLLDNVIFNQFSAGIHAYGSEKAFVEGYHVEGNVVFNNGSISAGNTLVDNILFATGGSLARIRVENNYTYMPLNAGKGYSRLGWIFGETANQDAVVRGNYWIGGSAGIELWRWNLLEYTGNTAYSANHLVTAMATTDQQISATYLWDRNRYYGSGLFRLNGKNQNFGGWQESSGLDRHSNAHSGRPTGVWTFIRPNRYESGRGHIVVYNWDLKPSVTVDLSGLMKPGTQFEIRDAQNYFGAAVASGVWNGTPVSIPMTGLAVAPAIGNIPVPPAHTAPEFGAFVVIPAQDRP